MNGFEQVKKMTAEVVASYDERIGAVEEIIEKSLRTLDQNRHAQQIVQSQLKETLAKVESLRKKDFDCITAPLLAYQEDREGEIKKCLTGFLKKQKELAGQLRRMIQAGIFENIPNVEKTIQEAIETTKQHILGFQKEQALIGERMQTLFQRKEELTLKEFKKTLDTLHTELGLNGNETIALRR